MTTLNVRKKWPNIPVGDESQAKTDDTSQCNYDNFCEHCEALSNVTFKRLPHIIILVGHIFCGVLCFVVDPMFS
jgi:hypothetical protein